MRKCDFKKVLSYFDDMNVLLRAVWIHNRAFVSKLQQKISMNKNLLLGHSICEMDQISKNFPLDPHVMDFFEILPSQCTHQEMKILKILLSSCERFQN